MKKIFYFLFLILVLPSVVFAAFNDANLTTDAVINIGNYNLNIYGSTASVESITVNSSSFNVTLLSSSTFSVSSPVVAGFNIGNTGASVTSTITCGNPSVLTLSPLGTSTVTVTPVSSCIATRTSHSSSGSYIKPVTLPTTTIIPFEGCNNRNTGFSTMTGQSCIGNTAINTISTINTSTTYNFGTITLRNGSTGEAVKELQRFLNTKLNLGLVVDGKLGPKTKSVVIVFQTANNLVPDGLVGKLTKAKMTGN